MLNTFLADRANNADNHGISQGLMSVHELSQSLMAERTEEIGQRRVRITTPTAGRT